MRVRVRKRLQGEFAEQRSIASAGAVDELPRRVIRVAAMDEHESDRGLLGRGKELVEQRERRLVRPMEILEHQTQRVLARKRADEQVEPVERLAADGVGCEVADPLFLPRLEREAEHGGEKG